MRPVADNLTTLAKHQDKLAIKPPAETQRSLWPRSAIGKPFRDLLRARGGSGQSPRR
jgi:hypothetical protein